MKNIFLIVLLIASVFLYGCLNVNATPENNEVNKLNEIENVIIKCEFTIDNGKEAGNIYYGDHGDIYLILKKPNNQCQACLFIKNKGNWESYLSVNPSSFNGCRWMKAENVIQPTIIEIIGEERDNGKHYTKEVDGKTYDYTCFNINKNILSILKGKYCKVGDFEIPEKLKNKMS